MIDNFINVQKIVNRVKQKLKHLQLLNILSDDLHGVQVKFSPLTSFFSDNKLEEFL